MDIYERYSDKIDSQERTEFDKFKTSAKDYAEQGFENSTVAELLQIDGCSKKVAQKLSEIQVTPDDYIYGDPPKGFEDVRKKVEQSVRVANMSDIEKFLTHYINPPKTETIDRIKLARATNLPSHYGEVVSELSPIIDAEIVNSRSDSIVESENKSGEREILAQELWGVWPPDLIRKHAKKENASKAILKKAKKKDLHCLYLGK